MTDNFPESTPVTRELGIKGIPHVFYRHPGQLHSIEQAAQERRQHPDQIVRSILFRLSEEDFVMVLVAGKRQISWHKLRKYLNQSRISMASEMEVMKITGYPLGAVSPFGIPHKLRVLVDESVLNQETISIGSGVRNTTIILRVQDMLQALDAYEISDLSGSDKNK